MGNLLPLAGQKRRKKAENLLGIAFGGMSKRGTSQSNQVILIGIED